MGLQKNIYQSTRYRKLALVFALVCTLSLNTGIAAMTQEMQGGTRMVLLAGVWLAQLFAFLFGLRFRVRSGSLPAHPSQSISNITHQLRTPVSLIVGFCEMLLSPARPPREPLPAAYQSDIEAIYRNAMHLQKAVEDVLDVLRARAIPASVGQPARTIGTQDAPASPISSVQSQDEKRAAKPQPDDEYSALRKSVIVLEQDPAVVELFRHHISQLDVIGARDIRDIEALADDTLSAVVIVSGEDTDKRIPEIPYIVGEDVPIIVCSSIGEPNLAERQMKTSFLIKPITFQALSDALERLGTPIPNILIIDDNRDNVEMISRMIESMSDPHRIWKTYSGREGLALMYEQPIDVVILDLLLPDMDGANLAQYIRADPRLAAIHILIVSAYHELAIASPPPMLSKISVLRFAGTQLSDLARDIAALVTVFSPTS
jgi:CheY-like chemotaxis protein